jgi:hypothetical protein
MIKPQIIVDDYQGRHNKDLQESNERLELAKSYRDLSTICIIPTRGTVAAKVVQNWWGLMSPMNQKFMRIFMIGMEVGAAYSTAIEQILVNPDLRSWKYILTLEEDNMPPPDGLLKLYESMDKYDVVAGLYWTKGEMGQPMIYGDPKAIPLNFIPQKPIPETVQECNGLGMGFNLFKMDIFRDPRVPRPYFRTLNEYDPGKGTKLYTQDLYFYHNIHDLGYKVACDTRIKVGHYDLDNDIVW